MTEVGQQVVSIDEFGKRFYTTALPHAELSAGLYRMARVRLGGALIPAFDPIEMSNDKPLEIDASVGEITGEIEHFFNRRDIFKKMGFSHKRGYLLHGPPGCGKSSALRLMEESFVDRFGGIVLFWDHNPDHNAQDYVEHIRKHEPLRPIMLVCEDIDSVIRYFESSILEFLDGQQGLDNIVLVCTTNNLDAIPSRIKDRPSRIDRLLEIGKPSIAVREKYLTQLGLAPDSVTNLAARTEGLSLAQLKEIVVATICLERPLAEVMERLRVADMTPIKVSLAQADEDYGD